MVTTTYTPDPGEDPLVVFLLDRWSQEAAHARALLERWAQKWDQEAVCTQASVAAVVTAARILRAMGTLRLLLDEHADNGGYVRRDDGTLVRSGPRGESCLTCVDASTLACGAVTEFTAMAPWPCMTVRLLALPYAGHKDYRAEWGIPAPVTAG